MIRIKSNTSKGYEEITQMPSIIDISYPSSTTRRGRVQDGGGTSPALTCGTENNLAVMEEKNVRPYHTDADGNARTIYAGMYKAGTFTHLRESGCSPTSVVEFNGKIFNEGDGLYTGCTEKFQRGGLNGLSRTLKSSKNDEGCVQNFRIRKLTERECFRLMGVRDEDIDKIKESGVSKSQQYKMAGNSIVCDVLMGIFDKMFVNTEPTEGTQLTIF